MPEKGVREWNYEAIKLALIGLKEKNLKVLNNSQASDVARSKVNPYVKSSVVEKHERTSKGAKQQ